MHNLKIHSLVLFGLCLIVIISSGFVLKSVVTERAQNQAMVLGASTQNSKVTSEINSYTREAENLTRKANSFFTTSSKRKIYSEEALSVLAKRKDLIERSLTVGIDINKINTPGSSVTRLAADTNLVEQRVTLTDAKINSLHVDTSGEDRPSFKYLVLSGKEQYSLVPTLHYLGDTSGRIARLTGIAFGSKLYAPIKITDIVNNEIQVEKPAPESGARNMLVILINFQDTIQTPFTQGQAKELISNGQFDKFYKEDSYDKVDFEADVYGWLTLNKNSDGYCEVEDVQADIDNFAIQNNIKINQYQHYVRILNCPGFWNNGYSSLGSIDTTLGGILGNVSVAELHLSEALALEEANSYPGTTRPHAWSNFEYLLSHEIGHGLGLLHANAWDCGENQIGWPCNSIEYGNYFDVMGFGNSITLHNNAYYKSVLGWLGQNDISHITQSGTYKISPLESKPPTDPKSISPTLGKRLALIEINGNLSYSVEYRSATGFDATLAQVDGAGLYIHKIDSSTSYLIDSQPTSLDWHEDVADSSLSGKNPIFFDANSGLTVESLGLSSPGQWSFEVTIEPATCVLTKPVIYDVYLTPSNQTYAMQVFNADNVACPNSDFHTEILPNTIFTNLVPDDRTDFPAYQSFKAGVHFDLIPGTPPGTYPVHIKTTNLTSGLSSTSTIDYIIDPPCVFSAPEIQNVEAVVFGGDQNFYKVGIHNRDNTSCLPSNFSVIIKPNQILTTESYSWDAILPNTYFDGYIFFSVIPGTPPGTYPVTIEVKNFNSGLIDTETVDLVVP